LVLNPDVTHWLKFGPRLRIAADPDFEQPSASFAL